MPPKGSKKADQAGTEEQSPQDTPESSEAATGEQVPENLNAHVDEILDDCRSYEWESAVRPWSEEVFSLIAEGRLPRGWDDVHRIQMLRMTISRASTAKLDQNRDNAACLRQFQQQPAYDQQKGGPPCQGFNSSQGCALSSGHVVQGKKMIHVCGHCISELSVAYPHSIMQCRNKKRTDRSHFQ